MATAHYAWEDATAEADAAGLLRNHSTVHNGWQIGPGGYATDGVNTVVAAELPETQFTRRRIFSTTSGVFTLHYMATGPTSGVRLYRSPDGIGAYVNVYEDATAGRMHDSLPLLIDCLNGRLVMVEYCTDAGVDNVDNVNKLWYSGDGGDNWSVLFTTAAGSIRHFHGGKYDPQYGRLYLFTGDATPKDPSILWTDDIDTTANSLADNPNLWKDRWGLSDYGRTTIDDTWVVGRGAQTYRTIDSVIYGEHMYWGMDSNLDGGVQFSRMHRSTLAVEELVTGYHGSLAQQVGNAVSEIWSSGQAANGLPLFVNIGQEPGTPYYGDNQSHLYCLQPDGRLTKILTINDGLIPKPTAIYNVGGYTIVTPSVGGPGTVAPDYLSFSVKAGRIRKAEREKLLDESGAILLDETSGSLMSEGVAPRNKPGSLLPI